MHIWKMSSSIHRASTIRECEKYTMDLLGMTESDLMEKAGESIADQVVSFVNEKRVSSIYIFCGPGNNGGDGAVAARYLIQKHRIKKDVHVVICADVGSRKSEAMTVNIEAAKCVASENQCLTVESFESMRGAVLKETDLVVDALFGIGLNKPLEGFYSDVVGYINSSDAKVISIDIPSGMYCDTHTPECNPVVIADITLCIQFAKLALLLTENSFHFGEVRMLDIGIVESEDISESASMRLVTKDMFANGWSNDIPFAHKGTFGHGLLIAGSGNMPGAAVLSATAAMRGGIGKLTVHTVNTISTILACSLPEAILDPDERGDYVSKLGWERLSAGVNAVAIGPGIGVSKYSLSLLKDVLDTLDAPIILDADALNMLSENKTRLAFLPKNSILTPHFGEFERLAGKSSDDFDRVAKAREFAMKYSVILVLKGHNTVISAPDGMQYFNTSGNSGMATAGSGDVLTGLLLALMAQKYNPLFAALLGVHIHGLAGDAYTKEHHPKTLIASDLPNFFHFAFNELSNNNSIKS